MAVLMNTALSFESNEFALNRNDYILENCGSAVVIEFPTVFVSTPITY
jgi:hypothetical protein